jgi:hypothetical protein
MNAKHPTLRWDREGGDFVAHKADGGYYVVSTRRKLRRGHPGTVVDDGFDLCSHEPGLRVRLGHFPTVAEAKARAEQHYAVTAHRTGG